LPSGKILSFKALPGQVGTGESTKLYWKVVKGSTVSLNDAPVSVADSLRVYPDALVNTYTLKTTGDTTEESAITVSIDSPELVDRAYKSDVTGSSNDSLTYSFSKLQNMVDGNNISRWQAATTPTSQWVQLDLGRIFNISKIIIRWGNKAYARQYSIQATNDFLKWTELKRVLNGTGGTNFVETIDNLTGNGRYVRFLLQSQGSGAYSIAEIYIYGLPDLTGVQVLTAAEIPKEYSLSQNYPDPFNPSTRINFGLVRASGVKLTVYNILGQTVQLLVNDRLNAGSYTVTFDATGLASGVYFYRLETADFISVKKMMLLK
jgi:hypothetical protein